MLQYFQGKEVNILKRRKPNLKRQVAFKREDLTLQTLKKFQKKKNEKTSEKAGKNGLI